LRVLTVARWYPSHDSPGRGSFVADLVRATVAAGVDARVVSFDRVLVRGRRNERDAMLVAARAAYDRVVTPAGLFVRHQVGDAAAVPVARLPVVRRPGTGDPAALIEDHLVALRPFLAALVGTWRPDVIHAHTGLPDGIVAAVLGRELGIPVVVSEHMSTIEAELADPVALERYRELLGPGVRLLAVSPSLASRVATLLGEPAEALGLLPNPVEDGSFPLADPAGRDPDELLWVGSIGEHKGLDVLLRAFAILHDRRPGLRLRMIGGERAAGDRARLEDLAAGLGVASSVSFDGWQAREAVASALARAGVFVHPSPSETFGVAAAEAILTGLLVASRQSGGVPWVIEQSGGYGSVADGDDAAAYARAIEASLGGGLPIDAATARKRLVDTVGEGSVARQAIELYEREIARARGTGAPNVTPPDEGAVAGDLGPPPTDVRAPTPDALPRILVATGREQAWQLVSALPVELAARLVLVTPAPIGDPVAGAEPPRIIRIVEAEPVPPPKPRPRGRSPLARLRRAVFRPAPTADDVLYAAIVAAVRGTIRGRGRGPIEVVAIDAPAAAFVARLGERRATLAPGSLRWLADRWAASRDRMPP